MYLIVGLGNPGRRYEQTRHNVGFRVIDVLSRGLGVRLTGHRFQSSCTRTKFFHEEIVLLRPETFMNLSGRSVRACVDYYDLDTERILVIHDDLDLPPGRVKVARNGGAGGHKGVSSILQHLGSKEFARVKVGIGRPRYGEEIEDYVLSPCYTDERGLMDRVIPLAVQACELFVLQGIEAAMNQINCKNLVDKEERN